MLREVANWLGPLGAMAADLLLQIFGFAASGASWRRCLCGARAPCAASRCEYAMWRLVAWPLGTVTVAAGLGLFPPPASLPAGAGG